MCQEIEQDERKKRVLFDLTGLVLRHPRSVLISEIFLPLILLDLRQFFFYLNAYLCKEGHGHLGI